MLIVQYDETTNKRYAKPLESSDIPQELRRGLVGQWSGHVPITVTSGIPTQTNHATTLIAPPEGLAIVSLEPFSVCPQFPGLFIVHHARTDYIYSALGGYELKLFPDGGASRGIDGDILDVSEAAMKSSFDICKTALTFAINCNGSTDVIRLYIQHNASTSRNVGNASAQNSIVHTTIFYAGNNPTHGIIP